MRYIQLKDVRASKANISDADFLTLMNSHDLRPVSASLVTFAVLRERFAREFPARGEAAVKVKALLEAVRQADADVATAILGFGIDANLPELTEVLDALPDQADAEIVRALGRFRKFQWELSGLDQAPTQDHLDTMARFVKLELLKSDANREATDAAALQVRRQEILEELLNTKDPIPATIDEIN